MEDYDYFEIIDVVMQLNDILRNDWANNICLFVFSD